MPNVEASKRDLERLIGKKLSRKGLEEVIEFAKGEIDSEEGDRIVIDEKDTNRPDLWSAEGIAREVRARIGKERGPPKYFVKKGKISCTIEKSVEKARPFIACALVKNVKVTGEFLRQVIQLQEKVGMTFGRKRKETGIGLYDFGKMTPPVFYKGYKDDEIEFVPLEFKAKMRPSEILQEHPKGKEFAHLLEGTDRYPIVIDSKGVVASMPPIINSEETGKVTEKTKQIFVEVTGFNWRIVNAALNVMVMALADRGGKIESVKIRFPKSSTYPKKPVYTPAFDTEKMEVAIEEIEKLSGLKLNNRQMIDLLERARYKAKIRGKKIEVEYPSYRQDILHPVDVIEDIIISYGFNKIKPEPVKLACTGGELRDEKIKRAFEEVCVGLGLQGVLSFTMTSKAKQAEMIGLDAEKEGFVEIANPVSENFAVFRKRLYPELLDFLSKNRHAAYPQKIFEAGKAVELDPKSGTGAGEKNRLCIVLCGKGAEFTTIKGVLDAVAGNIGFEYSLSGQAEPAFEKGKSGTISSNGKRGVLGELTEIVRRNFGIEQPAAVLELEI